MDWFLYDNSLRHERVKYTINTLLGIHHSQENKRRGGVSFSLFSISTLSQKRKFIFSFAFEITNLYF